MKTDPRQARIPGTSVPRDLAERNLRAALRNQRGAEKHVEAISAALKEAKGALELATAEVRRWTAEIYEGPESEVEE